MNQVKEGLVLKLERTFDAPVEKVFAALTTAEAIAHWFGPSSDYSVEVHTWEARPGGRYRISLTHTEGNVHTAIGEITELVENRLLAYTWSWEEQPPMDTLVTFRLSEVGGKTRLEFTHEGFAEEELRAKHEEGWTGALDRLAGVTG